MIWQELHDANRTVTNTKTEFDRLSHLEISGEGESLPLFVSRASGIGTSCIGSLEANRYTGL